MELISQGYVVSTSQKVWLAGCWMSLPFGILMLASNKQFFFPGYSLIIIDSTIEPK